MLEKVSNPIFILTSDDNTFWDEIKDDISPIYNYEHLILNNESDINTFTLLQQFNNFIMSNSTFIWWCAWLANANSGCSALEIFGCPDCGEGEPGTCPGNCTPVSPTND